MALLTNAAKNREYWLRNFYGVNLRAVEKWDRWPEAWVIPAGQANDLGVSTVLDILTTGDVEVHQAEAAFRAGESEFPAGSWVIPMRQPYASFAQTLLEVQEYPDLRLYPGGPPRPPYDVTAHTLPLLMDMEAVPVDTPVDDVTLSAPIASPGVEYRLPPGLTGAGGPEDRVVQVLAGTHARRLDTVGSGPPRAGLRHHPRRGTTVRGVEPL